MTYARNVKYDYNRVPLPMRLALATGRLEIRTDAIVSRLLIDARSGKATGVEYIERLTKNMREVRGKVVVLCASAIESVRILLNSECAKHPSGVGGSGGNLGRYLCDHVAYAQTGRVAERDVEPTPNEDGFDFAVAGLYIPSFCEKESRNFSGGYGIQVSIGRGRPMWSIGAFGEMQPRYENRVALDPTVKDAWGIPVAENRVQSFSRRRQYGCPHEANASRNCRRRRPAGRQEPRRSLASLRLLRSQVLTNYGALWPGGAIHETGGARMGDKPENSVLNSYCQCWDADNVFVTDGACFVSPGFQNPTLTMMALTVRACQFIVREYAKCVN